MPLEGIIWDIDAKKISWLHVTSHVNLYTTSMLMAVAEQNILPGTKTKEDAICTTVSMENVKHAEISTGAVYRQECSRIFDYGWSGADWRHVNSPFSLRRTPRLVTESVMERAKVNESSRW